MIALMRVIYTTFKYRVLKSFRIADLNAARSKSITSMAFNEREKDLLTRVSLQIHPFDGMYTPSAPERYLSVGISAIRCIDVALENSKSKRSVQIILDFPSGYGRVLRFLRVRFPDAEIFGCELKKSTLNFCQRWFGVKMISSEKDFKKIKLPQQFDLIWCGSLFTHIDELAAADLLKFFYDHLAPGGRCVLSAHGPTCIERIRTQTYTYHLTEGAQKQLITQFDADGFGYANYNNKNGYGISAIRHEQMLSIAKKIGDWEEILYLEQGWDNHQDVYSFEKKS